MNGYINEWVIVYMSPKQTVYKEWVSGKFRAIGNNYLELNISQNILHK